MTATVHYHFAPSVRVDTPFAADHGYGWNGDAQAVYRYTVDPTENIPGQLWERVAEGHKVRHSDAERMRYAVAILTGHDRGPIITQRAVTVFNTSGIIRAGERVK